MPRPRTLVFGAPIAPVDAPVRQSRLWVCASAGSPASGAAEGTAKKKRYLSTFGPRLTHHQGWSIRSSQTGRVFFPIALGAVRVSWERRFGDGLFVPSASLRRRYLPDCHTTSLIITLTDDDMAVLIVKYQKHPGGATSVHTGESAVGLRQHAGIIVSSIWLCMSRLLVRLVVKEC